MGWYSIVGLVIVFGGFAFYCYKKYKNGETVESIEAIKNIKKDTDTTKTINDQLSLEWRDPMLFYDEDISWFYSKNGAEKYAECNCKAKRVQFFYYYLKKYYHSKEKYSFTKNIKNDFLYKCSFVLSEMAERNNTFGELKDIISEQNPLMFAIEAILDERTDSSIASFVRQCNYLGIVANPIEYINNKNRNDVLDIQREIIWLIVEDYSRDYKTNFFGEYFDDGLFDDPHGVFSDLRILCEV